ncbi:MAG: hypothetical protein V4683_08415 [Bacteroidota bacterium]
MIPIHINNHSLINDNTIPDDIEELANRFWNSDSLKKDRYSIKKREINSTYLTAECAEVGVKYLLLKITQIEKMEGIQNQAKNKGIWFTENLADFVRNDGTNAIKNADGSINYISDPKDAEIFAFKESSFFVKQGSSSTTLNAIFYKGDLNEYGELMNQNKSRVYIFFEQDLNLIQRVIFKPFGNLLRIFLPKFNPAFGGPSSAGVRIPPKNTQ